MDCREVRDLADTFLSARLSAAASDEVRGHLESCEACRADMEQRQQFRGTLRSSFDRAEELQPRPDFIESLAAKLRPRTQTPRESARASWKTWSIPALAAAAIVAIAVGATAVRQQLGLRELAALARLAAGDHENCALSFRLAERPISLEEAARRYDPAYLALITVTPSSSALPAPIAVVERHSCVFEGHRFAHIVLRYQDQVISVLVTSDDVAPSEMTLQKVDGMNVASFRASTHAVFVVSPLNAHDTRQIARAMEEPISRALGAPSGNGSAPSAD